MLRDERATSAAGLKKIAEEVWRRIIPNYLKKLYESMPRRTEAVNASQGGHTKY